MIDLSGIKAISLDLDDTLWPIWPVIERAEAALLAWLQEFAPATARLYAEPGALRAIREHVATVLLKERPELKHDLSALRRESIRLALVQGGDDPELAHAAFAVFFDARQQVTLYEDALACLQHLSARYPLLAISNGNADLTRTGIHEHFVQAWSAQSFGVGKPDPRIFHAAAQHLDLQPGEVLHVGDDARLDVLGALDAGMQAVWLNRSGQPWPHPERPCLEVRSLDELRGWFTD